MKPFQLGGFDHEGVRFPRNSGGEIAQLAAAQLKGKLEKTMTDKSEIPAGVTRTSAGLRDAIFDELDAIRRGESNPTRANAVSKLAGSIVETVRMEVEVQKHRHSLSNRPQQPVENGDFGGTLSLGTG